MEGKQNIKQDITLTDRFGRPHNYLRLSLTDRCNMRCNYCMPDSPSFIPKNRLLSTEEIHRLVGVFVSLGIKKIRLTGGEPLIRRDFEDIAKKIAGYGQPLHLTTNATRLHLHFPLITELFSSLNISLDTLRPERFRKIAHSSDFRRTLDNINLALSGHLPVKINMVVIRDLNDDEIADFVELTLHHPVEIRFIEFMPFLGNRWEPARGVNRNEILDKIRLLYEIELLGREPQETTEHFRIPDAKGSFGIISTVSNPFCNDCNRIRVTADGKLKNCLFSQHEINLKDLLDDEERLTHAIKYAIMTKEKKYGGKHSPAEFHSYSNPAVVRSMTSIGG
jgi:cyclic pyranopterin phosphate synthase